MHTYKILYFSGSGVDIYVCRSLPVGIFSNKTRNRRFCFLRAVSLPWSQRGPRSTGAVTPSGTTGRGRPSSSPCPQVRRVGGWMAADRSTCFESSVFCESTAIASYPDVAVVQPDFFSPLTFPLLHHWEGQTRRKMLSKSRTPNAHVPSLGSRRRKVPTLHTHNSVHIDPTRVLFFKPTTQAYRSRCRKW